MMEPAYALNVNEYHPYVRLSHILILLFKGIHIETPYQ